jgi:hypothetical protein
VQEQIVLTMSVAGSYVSAGLVGVHGSLGKGVYVSAGLVEGGVLCEYMARVGRGFM